MEFVDLFLLFIDRVLDFHILGFSLYIYLVTIAIVGISFSIIHRMIKTKE